MQKKPYIIAVSGSSGAGKTTFVRRIIDEIQKDQKADVSILCLDSYYKDRSHLPASERKSLNFDHPSALDIDLLSEHLYKLKQGESIESPQYDFATHSRVKETTLIESQPIIFVEGILALHFSRLRTLFDLKIFLQVDADICVIRRIKRDTRKRGRSFDSVVLQYMKTVKQMALQYVEPSKQFADFTINWNYGNQKVIEFFARSIS